MRGAGAEAVTSALLSAPKLRAKACISMLPAIIRRQQKEEYFRAYVAECLRVISENTAKMVGGSYMQAHYSTGEAKKEAPDVTGEEILEYMKKRMGGGGRHKSS